MSNRSSAAELSTEARRQAPACARGALFPAAAAVALALILLLAGCKSSGGGSLTSSGGTSTALASGNLNADQARSVLMSLADSYTQTIVQPLDQLVATSKDPARSDWARAQRLATVSVSVANATGPNSVVGLLDMVVFATLKRAAVEEHWVPTLLKEEGAAVLEAHRRGEADAWAAAGRVFSASQVKELRELVDKWQREHRGQYYVGYTRFSDFDAYRSLTPDSPEAKLPGSLFGALYIDPLAGLDPVARELRSYRALTERLAFIVTRLPIQMSYQIDLGVHSATSSRELRQFVGATEKFAEQASRIADGAGKIGDGSGRIADATRRFAEVVAKYPQDLSGERQAAVTQLGEVTARERQAAIDQAARVVAAEREAVLRSIGEQEGRLRAVLADVKGLLDQADRVTASMNASTANTVTTTRHAADGALTHALVLALIFLAALLLGVPAALLGYRLACRRLLGASTAPRDPGGGAAGPGTGPGAGGHDGSADAAALNRRRVPL